MIWTIGQKVALYDGWGEVHVDPADIERLRDMLARPAEKPSPEPIVTAWSD